MTWYLSFWLTSFAWLTICLSMLLQNGIISFFLWLSSIPPGFPGDSDSKESACNAEDPGSVPGSARSPGEGNGYPLQYSCLENSIDRGACQATVYEVALSQKWPSDWHFHCVCAPRLLYPLICQWIYRLFPCLGYCEQCCYEHRSVCIFLNYSFVQIYDQEWDDEIIWQLY